MAGSSFGNIFRITTWGESHGKAIGVVVDGCPAGLALTEADIQYYLNQRKPGQSRYTTPRKEDDAVEILSGVFEGKTTGTPISLIVWNKNARSSDYSEIADYYRPGHADFTFDSKYGFRDYRGGGRSSARETIGRVAGGAIALKILENCGMTLCAYTRSIGPVHIDPAHFDADEIYNNPMYMPDAQAAAQAEVFVAEKMQAHDSVGGVIECRIQGMPAGIGDPVFEKLNANLAKAVCSLGAVKGFEIGDGFTVADACGSENNDAFVMAADGRISKKTNHAGGILGGMSDGSEIIFRAAIKPTPSISRTQQTVNKKGENIDIQIKGRHDPIIVPRAVVVVKSMAALAIVDALMLNMTARIDYLTDFYH
jgi:chorismate synthase